MNRRPFCSEISAETAEPQRGTASRVDHWLLIEYRGLWSHDALGGSGLSDQVKAALRDRIRALAPAKLLLVRRPERRDHEGLAVYFACSREGEESLRGSEVSDHGDLIDFDPSAMPPLDHPLFLVCTHGKHDRCCARYGRPLYEVLADGAEEDWVWQTTHVGGDRFAGNVVVLPEGLYYGRVRPEDAWPLLDDHLGGRVHLERFRGRSTEPFAVQAAVFAVREDRGLRGIADVQVENVSNLNGSWRVRVRGPGEVRYEVEVEVEEGPLTYLTCSAENLRRPPRFDVRILPARDA